MSKIDPEVMKELEALRGRTITISLNGLVAWSVIAQLQLALRHPANAGATAREAMTFALALQDIVAGEGVLRDVAEWGWDPEYDRLGRDLQ